METGVELISGERKEQIEKHGYTLESDAKFNNEKQLVDAAIKLSSWKYDGWRFTKMDTDEVIPWKWDKEIWFKMMRKSYKERLIIAGALIAAEIDRIQNDNIK